MTAHTLPVTLPVSPRTRFSPRHSLWWLVPVLTLAVLASGCASRSLRPGAGASEVGVASYYSDRHHGRKTASGEVFDRNGMSAAHRTLPFGTRVRVQHLQNGREVTVRINDRGPFVKGRIIDLSHRAAEKLDMIDSGVARVRVTPLD